MQMNHTEHESQIYIQIYINTYKSIDVLFKLIHSINLTVSEKLHNIGRLKNKFCSCFFVTAEQILFDEAHFWLDFPSAANGFGNAYLIRQITT